VGKRNAVFSAMAFHVNADYPPPKTWQQFEELYADTYAADWSDPALRAMAAPARLSTGLISSHGTAIAGRSPFNAGRSPGGRLRH
jgi:hypothetical protein